MGKSRNISVRKQSPLAWCAEHQLLCFSVAAAVWVSLLYSRALGAPFVYDDLDQIVNNPSLQPWAAVFARFVRAPVAFSSSFFGAGGSTFRPVFWLSLALDRRLWGLSPAGFHFTNLLLHWLNGVLLFALLRRLGLQGRLAACAALVWLGLPIHSEVVAWISARAYLLSTLFSLLALVSACVYVERRSWPALLAFSLSAVGAVFSHEQGLLLLPLVALVLYAKARADARAWRWLVGMLLLVDGVCFGARVGVGAHAGHGAASLWVVGEEFWMYVQLIFLPLHMSLERSTSVPANHPTLLSLTAWVGLLLLVGSAIAFRTRQPRWRLAVLCGCVALVPYCGFVSIYQGMAERFVYLAAIGFVVAVVGLVGEAPGDARRVLVGLGLLWVGWGAWRLRGRVQNWTDPVALYRSSLEATPDSPYLRYNLGFSLREGGDQDGALAAYQDAVRLRPDYPEALTSIGDIYAKQGKVGDSVGQYKRSLAIRPNDGKTIVNYGAALERVGDRAEAEQQFRREIALVPNDSAAYVDLGALFNDEGRTDEAIQAFQRAISANPNDPDAYFDLAVMLQQRGQDDVALAFYKKVLRLRPDDPQTMLYISRLHVAR